MFNPLKECFTLDLAPDRGHSFHEIATRWLFQPGYKVVVKYRIASLLRKVPYCSKLSTLLLCRLSLHSGVEINSNTPAEPGLKLPHPHDVVIGYGALIGRNVTIYNGVTLGAKGMGFHEYPVVGKDVIIYTGAKILGGISIGNDAVIGANSVVLSDVPPHSIAVGSPARIINKQSANN